MGLDIRLPIGLMFSLLGPILVVTGLLTDTALNTNTGASMLVFGAVMLHFGLKAQKALNAEMRAAEASSRPGAARPGGH
jgi:hypothetical protein